MKVLKYFLFPGLKMKSKIIIYYFCISFLLVGCIGEKSELWAVCLAVINLANSVRLINGVKFPKNFLED